MITALCDNPAHIDQLCEQLDLGSPSGSLGQVGGGFHHRMWQLDTNCGSFAIKQLADDLDMQNSATVERINAGNLKLRVDVKDGTAQVDELRAKGDDLELEGSGTVRLAKPIKMSRLDMLVRLKITDNYRERNDRTRALFSLMDFNPRLKAARTSDGALQYRLSGSPGARLRTTPAGRAKGPGEK